MDFVDIAVGCYGLRYGDVWQGFMVDWGSVIFFEVVWRSAEWDLDNEAFGYLDLNLGKLNQGLVGFRKVDGCVLGYGLEAYGSVGCDRSGWMFVSLWVGE